MKGKGGREWMCRECGSLLKSSGHSLMYTNAAALTDLGPLVERPAERYLMNSMEMDEQVKTIRRDGRNVRASVRRASGLK